MPSKLIGQIALCVFSCLGCTAEAQEPTTAEEIIAKHVEAIGGRAALDACKTMRTTGKITPSSGMEVSFVDERKHPDKSRIEAETARGESFVQAFDGQIRWSDMFGQPREMPEAPANAGKSSKHIDVVGGPLVAYRKEGHRVEFVGKKEVHGRQAYKLKFISKKEAGRDYVVPPLEGLWWAQDMDTFIVTRDKSALDWTMMIMTPEWVTQEMFAAAVHQVTKAKNLPALPGLHLERYHEGLSVQILHLGSYDDEGPTLARLHKTFRLKFTLI